MTTQKKMISCPTCGKKGVWTKDNSVRPFCSERCKLIDLGKWADEKHRVPGEPVNPGDELSDEDKNSH
jgi:endogenous inhibitor of DNA gyrase (YacG/DUF329 family)